MQFLCDCTQKAVSEVFGTMLSLEVRTMTAGVGAPNGPVQMSGMVSSVGIAGKISGTLYLNVSEKLACALVEKMVGVQTADAGAPEVLDVLGELTNMTTGAMKAHTSNLGYNGWLTTPLVMRGERITVEPKDAAYAVHGRFSIPSMNEEFDVHAFAKLS